MTNPDGIDLSAIDVAGQTIATLDEETMDRIRAPIMERLARVESAVEEILYFTRIAAGAFSCWKCKKPMKNWDPVVYGSDGRFYHPECFDEKEIVAIGGWARTKEMPK